MAHDIRILECSRHLNQKCEQEVMRIFVGRCLGTMPNTGSVVVRDGTVQRVTPGSPESLEGRNSVNTCWNGASEESIGVYAKIRCQ